LDLLDAWSGDEKAVSNSKTYSISACNISSLLSIYFALVVLGAYLVAKEDA
jgi:hypothetical protein